MKVPTNCSWFTTLVGIRDMTSGLRELALPKISLGHLIAKGANLCMAKEILVLALLFLVARVFRLNEVEPVGRILQGN